MKIVSYIIILLLIILFLDSILSTSSKTKIIEGMETKTNCETETKTTIYKNAGTIDNLKEQVDKVMKKVDMAIATNNAQNLQISNMSKLQEKYDKVAEETKKIAEDNKAKILRAVENAKEESAEAESKQKELEPI